jgi:murein DD-endopeptidase MepM/ murein hydrolase activator NlpD
MHRALAAAGVLAAISLLSAGAPIHVDVAARGIQPGELVVLTITTAEPVDALNVRAFDHPIGAYRVASDRWRALVGIDLDVAPGTHDVSIEATSRGSTAATTYPLQVRAKVFPTRSLSVDEAFVNPPAGVQARIAREADELRRIWQTSAAERLWTSAFIRPVPGAAVSRFGSRSVYNGQPRSPHGGADFMSPAGTPIHAPNAGRVVLARDLYFTGNTIVIDHGLDLFSMLAHLSSIDVHEGDTVSAGQVVGLVGATGRVTGAHLHWAVRASDARIDPLSVLALLGPEAK